MIVSTHTFTGKTNKFVVTTDYVGLSIEIGEDNVVNIYQTDGRLNVFGKRELIKSIENKSNVVSEITKGKNGKAKV